MTMFQEVIGKYLREANEKGYEKGYSFIPLNRFPEILDVAMEFSKHLGVKKPRFLDVGCGFGFTLALAEEKGCDASGIEFFPSYVHVGNRFLCRLCNAEITQCDALTFGDYGKFDIIYYYEPMTDAELMMKLSEKIHSEMSEKCVFVPVGYVNRKTSFYHPKSHTTLCCKSPKAIKVAEKMKFTKHPYAR
jgi:SAM-dependent methyltransferase